MSSPPSRGRYGISGSGRRSRSRSPPSRGRYGVSALGRRSHEDIGFSYGVDSPVFVPSASACSPAPDESRNLLPGDSERWASLRFYFYFRLGGGRSSRHFFKKKSQRDKRAKLRIIKVVKKYLHQHEDVSYHLFKTVAKSCTDKVFFLFFLKIKKNLRKIFFFPCGTKKGVLAVERGVSDACQAIFDDRPTLGNSLRNSGKADH